MSELTDTELLELHELLDALVENNLPKEIVLFYIGFKRDTVNYKNSNMIEYICYTNIIDIFDFYFIDI